MEGDVVTLYFNYDTLAKHHRNESKICKFVRELPQALADHGVEMITPTEAVRKYKDKIVKLTTLKTETTARYGMHSMMGNHMQHLYLNELVIIGQELENIKDVREYDTFKHIYGCLGQSDLLLDMNSNNFQIAYERGVNLFSILSDLRRAIREVKP
jgi:alpha-amylase